MQILEPKVESWLQNDTIDHIARCARVCYASDNSKNNAKNLVFHNGWFFFTHFTENNCPPIYLCSTLQTANLLKSKQLRATFFDFS